METRIEQLIKELYKEVEKNGMTMFSIVRKDENNVINTVYGENKTIFAMLKTLFRVPGTKNIFIDVAMAVITHALESEENFDDLKNIIVTAMKSKMGDKTQNYTRKGSDLLQLMKTN